ncbi:MAG TPA: hypothetical protein PLE54_03395 [Burkholderiaceae bacterium]|nr:hypothetical protein [Burkholderiaceae bacterium]HQR69622.1 hypothetical protein [Burkholderiaceae bacterium]
MFDRSFWEIASYVVTVIGLPLAIFIFIFEQRKERAQKDDEIYQLLSNAYNDFLKVMMENPDLRLRSETATLDLSPEQQERMLVIFDMLISLLERAYLTAYGEGMTPLQLRRWNSWEDFMREWARRDDFYYRLPRLLKGEDEEFAAYLSRIAEDERSRPASGLKQVAH